MQIILICNRIKVEIGLIMLGASTIEDPSDGHSLARPGLTQPKLTRRGLFGFLIVGAHAGVIALLSAGIGVRHERGELPPVIVDFLLERPSQLDPPRPSDPKLVAIAPPAVEAPVESLSIEMEVHSDIQTDAPAFPTPAPTTTEAGDSPSLAELSEVAYLEPPTPRYPPESKHAREEGRVVLKVLIDEAGHARSVNVYRSSGHPRLDEAACQAIQRAVFKPFLDGGIARAAVAIIPVEFSLHGSGDRGRRSG
jgi:protein TonB